MKYYYPMHKTEYSEEDIKDMINPVNIKHHYSPDTYWEPGEDYISCDIQLDEEFNDVVKIAELYFYDEDYPFAIIINGNTYCLGEKEGWEKVVEHLGWVGFENFDIREKLVTAEDDLECWKDGIANKKAWEIIEDGQENY